MDVAKALGISADALLHRCIHSTQMDVAKASGMTPQPVLHKNLHRG